MEYKEQIKNFLEDKENYSLLISGSWGVGKTHLWKEIENELNYIKNPNKQVKNIVYVSLFGKEHYKEIFDTYKEKCIDLNIHIRSKAEVISQILKEKIPEIPKEIIPYSMYGFKNLRNLNKTIKTLEFFNKELQFTDRLKQNKEYKAFFIEISNKIISNYENIDSHNLNKAKQEFIPLESAFLKTIDNIIKDYVSNGLIYSIPKYKKEEFERELEQYRFYKNLFVLKELLQNSIQYPNSVNKDQFEDFFNSVDEEQLRDFVYNLGYIDFIALDRTFHFDKNEKNLKMKKYCLELAKVHKYDEKFINIICDNDEVLKQYYKDLNKETKIELNNYLETTRETNKRETNKYKHIRNYSDFLANLEKINEFSIEEINEFLDNKMILSYCDIYFSLEETDKNKYPQLYNVYKSINSTI